MSAFPEMINTFSFNTLNNEYQNSGNKSLNVSPFGIAQLFDLMFHVENKHRSNIFSNVIPNHYDAFSQLKTSHRRNVSLPNEVFSSVNAITCKCSPGEKQHYIDSFRDINDYVNIDCSDKGIRGLILSNTFNLSCNWRNRFTSSGTGDFKTASGNIIPCEFLTKSLDYDDKVFVTPEVTAVKTFTSNRFSFEAIKLHNPSGILTLNDISSINYQQASDDHVFKIPQFTVEKQLNLIPHLQHHDIPILNYKIKVDDSLYVTDCGQNTKFELGPEGFKATAFTYCRMLKGGFGGPRRQKIPLVFDSPFYWIIRDSNSNILFMGIYNA